MYEVSGCLCAWVSVCLVASLPRISEYLDTQTPRHNHSLQPGRCHLCRAAPRPRTAGLHFFCFVISLNASNIPVIYVRPRAN
jgi:hypothetical protein